MIRIPLPVAVPLPPTPKEVLKRLPLFVAKQAGRVPFSLQRPLMLKLMHQAFQEPLEDGDFEFLEDKWLQVEIQDLELSWFFSYADGKLQVAQTAEADAAIRGNLKEFLLLANRSEDPDTLFFQRRLMIEGDTEVGLEVKNLMDAVDHDNLPPLLKLILTRGTQLANRLF